MLDFLSSLAPRLTAVALLLWGVSGALYLYRLARYFQLEGYDSQRFLRWWSRQQREQEYFVIASLCTMMFFLVNLFPELPIPAMTFTWLILVFGFFSRPRDREVKQPFTPTQRAVRLLLTAVIVPFVIAYFVVNGVLPADRRDIFYFLLWVMIVAGGFFHFAQFLLPLADIINWPIEEGFRRYYLLIARAYLDRSGATVIAITGSYGKTSTKHYLQHILEGKFRSLMTPKSYNTLLGISRVINDVLSKDVSYDYFIVETDAYFVGENARICKLVGPKLGMVMTVGPMHLERLGSMENIAKAQYEVIQALPPDGAGFFNGDDPAVREMAERNYPQTRITVSQHGIPGAQLEAINVRMTADGLDFDVRDNQSGEVHAMHAPLYGDHNVTNILMAAAVAHHLGMSLAEIGMRVATLQPAEHRLIRRVLPDGTVIIDDTYSANPVGTQTALGVLGLHRDSTHRIVVSSGMFELGTVSDQENHKLGERMAEVATDVILIGAAQTKPVKDGLETCHFPPDHVYVVNSLSEATAIYKNILAPGDTLLMLTDLPDLYA